VHEQDSFAWNEVPSSGKEISEKVSEVVCSLDGFG
jgi:hypothetical protein